MNLDTFLLAGFALLPQSSVVFSSGTVSGVWNDARHHDDKSLGGFEPNDEAVFTCPTSQVENPKSLLGHSVTRSGDAWRILRVRTGDTFTHFTLVSPDKA